MVILDGEFAEPEIVAEMAKLLIEDKTDLKAEIKDAMTPVFGFNEMNEGKIDLMLSYDGQPAWSPFSSTTTRRCPRA